MHTALVSASVVNLQAIVAGVVGARMDPVSLVDMNPYIHRTQEEELMREYAGELKKIAALPQEERFEARRELNAKLHEARLGLMKGNDDGRSRN